MCLAKVYQGIESDRPILENVAHIKLLGDHVEIETLFGKEEVIVGKVVELDFVNSRVVLEKQP